MTLRQKYDVNMTLNFQANVMRFSLCFQGFINTMTLMTIKKGYRVRIIILLYREINVINVMQKGKDIHMWEKIQVTSSAELEAILNSRKIVPEHVLYFGEEFINFGQKRYTFIIYTERTTKNGNRKKAD